MNKYKCAFCGETIDSEKENITSLLVTTNWLNDDEQQDQQLFCHLDCLKKMMNSESDLYIDDED